jgi:hypothetical protein
LAADIYDDGSVVIYNDGAAYDGDVRKLATVCKELGAKVHNTLVPKPLTTYTLREGEVTPEEPFKDLEVETGENGLPVVTISKGSGLPVKVSYPVDPIYLVKDSGVRAWNDLLPEEVQANADSGGMLLRLRYATAVDECFGHLVEAQITGEPVNRKAIWDALGRETIAEYSGHDPYRGMTRGGSLEDWFEKIRNIPKKKLFTGDASTLYPNKGAWKIEEAAAVRRTNLLMELDRTYVHKEP